MTSTRVPAPRLRQTGFIALGLLVALTTAGAVRAQPIPAPLPAPGPQLAPPTGGGNVQALQDLLRGEVGPDLAARKARMTDLINLMDLTQLSRVLLLQEWRTLESSVPRTEAERKRMDDDTQARTLAAERFREKAKEAIKAAREAPMGGAPQERSAAMLARAATADLIAETAAAGRKLDYLSQMAGGPVPGRPGTTAPRIGYLAQQLSDLTPDLIELTRLNDPAVPAASSLAQRAAARALGQIQPLNPAEVVSALEQLLADRNNAVDLRLTAARALDSLAQAASEEMQRSLGLDDNIQNRFLDFAQAIWSAVLRQGLADQPVEVRRTCLTAFSRIATEMLDISVLPESNLVGVRDTDPAIAKLIDERMSRYYQRLAEVFAEYGKNAGSLAAAARDEDPTARLTALSILADLANVRQRLVSLTTGAVPPSPPPSGPPGPPASDGKTIKPGASRAPRASVILVRAEEPARDKSQQESLDSVARGLDQTLGALQQALRAPDEGTRRAAVDVLEILGPAAYPALDALTGALYDPDKFVRWAAARTLGNLAQAEADKQRFTAARAEAAVRGTAELLRDEDVGVRLAAAVALAKYGSRARAAAPILTATLNHSQTDAALNLYPTPDTEPDLIKGDPSIRIAAFIALEAIDDDAAIRALPEAVVALKDGNIQVREAAADMIGREGPKVSAEQRAQLVRELGKAITDPDGDVRRSVSGALLRLMPQNNK